MKPAAAPEAVPKCQPPAPAPDARTVLVTQSCPPQVRADARVLRSLRAAQLTRFTQMVSVREGRGPWACSQFELQRLIGSGKTSNVYQARAPRDMLPCCALC